MVVIVNSLMSLSRRILPLGDQIHPACLMQKVQVIWACQKEMAMYVEDILSRTIRTLLLDAKVAYQMAQTIAEIMATERGDSFSKSIQKLYLIQQNIVFYWLLKIDIYNEF